MIVTCPYCGREAEFIDSKDYYSNGISYGMIYICRKCDATCGTHRKTGKPFGSLANKKLRELRKQCHAIIDPWWKSGKMTRNEAYRKLAKIMQVPIKNAHIGIFRENDCRRMLDEVGETEQ